MMRKIIESVAAMVALTVLIVLAYTAATSFFEQRRVADGDEPTERSASVQFVEMCAGHSMDTEELQLLAVSGCIGRVRGFVDGSAFVNHVVQTVGGRSVSVWCVSPNLTTDKILDAIMDWVDAHPEEYYNTVREYGPESAANVVMIKAIRSSFPCTNS